MTTSFLAIAMTKTSRAFRRPRPLREERQNHVRPEGRDRRLVENRTQAIPSAGDAALALLFPAVAGVGREAGQGGGLAVGDQPQLGHFGDQRRGGDEADPGYRGQGNQHPVQDRVGHDNLPYSLPDPVDLAVEQLQLLAALVVELVRQTLPLPGRDLVLGLFRISTSWALNVT